MSGVFAARMGRRRWFYSRSGPPPHMVSECMATRAPDGRYPRGSEEDCRRRLAHAPCGRYQHSSLQSDITLDAAFWRTMLCASCSVVTNWSAVHGAVPGMEGEQAKLFVGKKAGDDAGGESRSGLHEMSPPRILARRPHIWRRGMRCDCIGNGSNAPACVPAHVPPCRTQAQLSMAAACSCCQLLYVRPHLDTRR